MNTNTGPNCTNHPINIISSRLSTDEQETILRYDPVDKKWYVDTSIQKHITKMLKQGWTVENEWRLGDKNGQVVAMQFSASEKAVSFRDLKSLASRSMSEDRKAAMAERLAKARAARAAQNVAMATA